MKYAKLILILIKQLVSLFREAINAFLSGLLPSTAMPSSMPRMMSGE